jgi:hypothetical protein
MKYINPLSLLSELSDDSDVLTDRRQLSLQKKKLLAEIELSERNTLVASGVELNKNDVLNLFDKLADTNALQFHQAIAADTTLLHFLTEGFFNGDELFNDNKLYHDALFIDFISPYYEEVFTNAVLKAFYDVDTWTMQTLWANPMLMDGDHREKSYRRLNRYLYEQKNKLLLLKQQSVDERKASRFEFERYFNGDLVAMLNKLPTEFHEFVDDYALDLINTGVELQNIEPRLAVEILHNVRLLHCDDYIQQQNEERYKVMYYNLHNTKRRSTGGGFSNWHWGWLIFVVVRVLFSLFGSSNSNSSTDNYRYETNINDNEALKKVSFTSSNTYKAVDMFTDQLSNYASDQDHFKNTSPTLKSFESGTNIYRTEFNKLRLNVGGTIADTSSQVTVKKLSDIEDHPITSAWFYNENLTFENKSAYDAIAIIHTEDSVFSTYVKSHDTASLKVRDGVNSIHFYLGKNFDSKKFVDQYFTSTKSNEKIQGVFRTLSPVTVKYLREPFYLIIDSEINSSQDKKSWFMIEDKNGLTDISFETLSSTRIQMMRYMN